MNKKHPLWVFHQVFWHTIYIFFHNIYMSTTNEIVCSLVSGRPSTCVVHIYTFVIYYCRIKKTMHSRIGKFVGAIPSILYVSHHSPCPLLDLWLFQMHQIYFTNEPLNLILLCMPLVYRKPTTCLLIIIWIFKQAPPLLFIIWKMICILRGF